MTATHRLLILGACLAVLARAQDDMSGMQMSGMHMDNGNAAGMFLRNNMSGTAQNPEAWPMPMLTASIHGWSAGFMGQAFLDDTQQSGPRGGDKFYSTNWFMANAERPAGRRSLPVRVRRGHPMACRQRDKLI